MLVLIRIHLKTWGHLSVNLWSFVCHSLLPLICPADLSALAFLDSKALSPLLWKTAEPYVGSPPSSTARKRHLQYSRAITGLTLFLISQRPVLHYLMHNVLKTEDCSFIYILSRFFFFSVLSRRLNSVTITSSWLEAADNTGTFGEFVRRTHILGHTPISMIYRL